MLIIPSAPLSLFGLLVCASQAEEQRSVLPTNAYLMSLPPIIAWLCQPQYTLQKPEVSLTSEVVNTKYTPFTSFGNILVLTTLVTICRIVLSLRFFPRG